MSRRLLDTGTDASAAGEEAPSPGGAPGAGLGAAF